MSGKTAQSRAVLKKDRSSLQLQIVLYRDNFAQQTPPDQFALDFRTAIEDALTQNSVRAQLGSLPSASVRAKEELIVHTFPGSRIAQCSNAPHAPPPLPRGSWYRCVILMSVKERVLQAQFGH